LYFSCYIIGTYKYNIIAINGPLGATPDRISLQYNIVNTNRPSRYCMCVCVCVVYNYYLCHDIIIGYYWIFITRNFDFDVFCPYYAVYALSTVRSNDLGDRFRHYIYIYTYTNVVVQYYTAVTRSLRLYYYYYYYYYGVALYRPY